MLKTRIKASHITNLTDARYFAALGVEWLNFSLDPASQNFILPQELKAIKGWVEGPKIVGEFGMQEIEDIVQSVLLLQLDEIQVGPFFETTKLRERISQPIHQELIVETLSDLSSLAKQVEKHSAYIDYFVINFAKNGISWAALSAEPDALSKLQALAAQHSVIVAFAELQAGKLSSILDQVVPYGLQLSGGAEEKTGVKSYDDLDAIFDQLMEDD